MSKTIIFDAGHGKNTPGKRTPNGAVGVVNEWTLNDMVCRYIAGYLADYDVKVLRCDDIKGVVDTPLTDRTNTINLNNPDLAISIHHNANTGAWGEWTGVEVYSHPNKPKRDADLATLFVDEMAKVTGLRNRGAKQQNFHMVRETKPTIPTALCEGGFMDSTVDYPVITSEKGQRAYAQAVANVCVSYLNLQKKAANTQNLTPITGKSTATAAQMEAYLRRVNPNATQAIFSLIPIYLSEGAAENIRGDIAFAQSLIETGNFTFSGGTAVILSQNNFCGMSVTSMGVKGNSYKTPKDGILAQIQHLKAYANTEPLKTAIVVPTVGESRFKFVERGVSPYVEWLGQQENPSGKGWAAGKDYGAKILNILRSILNMSTTQPQNITAALGTTKYIVDGKAFPRDGILYKGELYLPAAEIFRFMGMTATWDGKTDTTTVTTKK